MIETVKDISPERRLAQYQIKERLSFSQKFRRVCTGLAMLAGVWAAASTDIDLSSKIAKPEFSVADKEVGNTGNTLVPMVVIGAAAVAETVEKVKTKKKIDLIMNDYAGTDKKAGLNKSTLVLVKDDFREEQERQPGVKAGFVDVIEGGLRGMLPVATNGLMAYASLELYETFATHKDYYNEWLQRGTTGWLAGGMLLFTIGLRGGEEQDWDNAMNRLDNIDTGLKFAS